MASFQSTQRTRSGRSTRAPTRFNDETFTKGSGVVSDIESFKTLGWRWNQDSEYLGKTAANDTPDLHDEDNETVEYNAYESDQEEDNYEPLMRTRAIRPSISNGVIGHNGFTSMVQRWSEDTGL